MRRRIIAGIVLLTALLLSGGSMINYLEPTEVALTWNPLTGERGMQLHAGWNLRAPWVFVSTVSTAPQRLCLTSTAHAAVNCRLAQFVPEYHQQFLATEGFRWYWWSNRFSFNFGYREEYRGFKDVMRGYAFSSQKYPFIRILREYEGS